SSRAYYYQTIITSQQTHHNHKPNSFPTRRSSDLNGKTERYNVKAEENWTHTFEDLPKYDSNGNEIVYTVTEEGEYEFYQLKEVRSEEHTSELQSRFDLVCRLLLEKKKEK